MSEDPILDASLPQECSDTRALQQYRQKLSALNHEIDLAHANNDLGTSEKLQIERDQILEHLKSDIGLPGRSRVFSNERERARKSVSSAIDKAIGAIKDQDPILAEHLRNNIKTGYKFSYRDTHTPCKFACDSPILAPKYPAGADLSHSQGSGIHHIQDRGSPLCR
jgi:hypothetical protein